MTLGLPKEIGVETLAIRKSLPNLKKLRKEMWPVGRSQEISADADADEDADADADEDADADADDDAA